MSKLDGGSAFPIFAHPDGVIDSSGMTLRDWFAGMALEGLLARGGDYTYIEIVDEAYKLADAMLQARESQ